MAAADPFASGARPRRGDSVAANLACRGAGPVPGRHAAPTALSELGEIVVDKFRDAGFVLACRTNTPEFGPITAAENLRYGPTRNPWDPERTPGGSSGGAVAAVAAGMFPIAHSRRPADRAGAQRRAGGVRRAARGPHRDGDAGHLGGLRRLPRGG